VGVASGHWTFARRRPGGCLSVPFWEGGNPSASGEAFRRFAVRKIDCARQYVRKPVEGGVVMPVRTCTQGVAMSGWGLGL